MPTDATNQANDIHDAENQKVTFDDKQQAKVDQLIKDAQGRAARDLQEANRKLAEQMADLQKQLDDAKSAHSKAKTPGQKQETVDDIETIKAQMAEIAARNKDEMSALKKQLAAKDAEVENARKEAINVKKSVNIQSAASKFGFLNLDMVSKLTENNVKYDDQENRFLVVDDRGNPRMNSSYEPMTLAEFYQEFATSNPFLVRGDVKGGSGSTEAQRNNVQGRYEIEQIFGKKSNSGLANKLARENPAEYKRMKAAAIERGLI